MDRAFIQRASALYLMYGNRSFQNHAKKEAEIRLILVRHGETQWNRERRVQGGGSDTELNETGKVQAQRLGEALSNVKVDAIYSSPLKRALDTARIIASYHKLPVEVEPDFREIEAGELEGLSLAEFSISFSQFILRWREGNGQEKLPGGESVADLEERVWYGIQRIKAKHDSGTVILVTHFFCVVVAICKALGWPLTTLERLRVQTGSMSIVDLNENQPRLVLLGDTCHLKDIPNNR